MSGYIHVVGWERHQHPDAARSSVPTWIKVHTRLLDDAAYLDLTAAQRAVLLGLWLLYARARREVRDDTVRLTRQLGMRVTRAQLLALNHAGFIEFAASRSASNHASLEVEVEVEKKPPPPPFDDRTPLVLNVLAQIDKPGYRSDKLKPERLSIVISRHPDLDVALEAEKLADWERYGGGERKQTRDGVARFRSWLSKAAEPAPGAADESEVDYPWHPDIVPPANWMQ